MKRSIDALSDQLDPADDAMIELAMTYARRLDAARTVGDESYGKAIGWLGPHLANVLRSLGVSQEGRKAAGLGAPKQRTGVLERLRQDYRQGPGVYHPADGLFPIAPTPSSSSE